MSDVSGIFVSLTTGSGKYEGTDDHVYLGVCGTVGGREFALDVDDFDDWEEGSVVTYSFGQYANFYGGKEPATAADQLDRMTICMPNVTHVYLRKQGDRTSQGDDFWELASCRVHLHTGSSTRIFESTGRARLGNEYGHKVWLAESGDEYVDMRMVDEGDTDCDSE